MTTASYAVEGLTCGYCMAEVLENVHSLAGVTEVAVDLVRGGQSRLIVTSGSRLKVGTVRAAVENAGFDLSDAEGQEVRHYRGSPSTSDGYTYPDQRMMSWIAGVNS